MNHKWLYLFLSSELYYIYFKCFTMQKCFGAIPRFNPDSRPLTRLLALRKQAALNPTSKLE